MKELWLLLAALLLVAGVSLVSGCASYRVPAETVHYDATAPGRAAAMDSLRDQVLSTCDADAKKGKKNGFDGRVTSNGDSYAAQYTGACVSGDDTVLTKTPAPQQAAPLEVRRQVIIVPQYVPGYPTNRCRYPYC